MRCAPVFLTVCLGERKTDTWASKQEKKGHASNALTSLIKSPIVEVVVGSGETRTTYSAHEAVLLKSPEFGKHVEKFAAGGVNST